MTAKPPARRCAVYTRKSSEEGLEQDFNSLHAQREACEAFIHRTWLQPDGLAKAVAAENARIKAGASLPDLLWPAM